MDRFQWSWIEFTTRKAKETKVRETKEKVEKVKAIKEKTTTEEEEDTEKVKVAEKEKDREEAKKGGRSIRQVEGKGYGDGSGKGGQGVVCYSCGKTGHIASEYWSAPNNKGKEKAGKGKIRNVQETGEEEWNNEGQQSSSSSQARAAPAAAKGNEQVRRLISTRMPYAYH